MARPLLPSLACLLACASLVACAAESGGEDPPGLEGGGESGGPGGGGASPGDPSAPGATDPSAPGAGPAAACVAQPKCDGASTPDVGGKRAWNSGLSAYIAKGTPYHRGRDMIYTPGDPQWVIGKFTYTLVDKEIKGEDVDVWVERGCAGSWEKLGTAKTTEDGAHATTEGVDDSGGRVYFQIPQGKELGLGRHRVRLVVAGDLTSTDLVLDVVPKGTKIVVSDVDGTLTSSESAEYPAMLTGDHPGPQPEAADVLKALASKGYRVVYLTARPEWLTNRTREFIDFYGFPRGVVHTTTGATGALGAFATAFKAAELARYTSRGLEIAWALGNQASDGTAYETAKVMPLDHRVFLGFTDPDGGRTIASYGELLPGVTATPALCK